jgi:deoxyribonuclease V
MPPSRACWPNVPWWSRGSSKRPGEFCLREFPPLRAVLDDLTGLGLLVADGYADLDPAVRPGLGAYAHAEFGIPVMGVAKSRFRTATHSVPVVRGSSARPLFITAAGILAPDAADLVRRMLAGSALPDELRRAGTLARAGPPAVSPTASPADPCSGAADELYGHVDHGCGDNLIASADGRRLHREPGTAALKVPCQRHLRAVHAHAFRPMSVGLTVLHPAVPATRIEGVSYWLQLKLLSRPRWLGHRPVSPALCSSSRQLRHCSAAGTEPPRRAILR